MSSSRITLTQYNGYFAAAESLAGLKAGPHTISISNQAGKLVGFQIQDLKSQENLEVFTLEPGQSKEIEIEIPADGVRFRCPLNPTPWYDMQPMG